MAVRDKQFFVGSETLQHGRQTGAALIIVLGLVSVMSVTAVVAFDMFGMFVRKTTNSQIVSQAREYAMAGEILGAKRAGAVIKANELFGVVGVRLLLNDPQDTNFLVLHSSDREYDQTLLSLKGSRRLSESLFLEVNGSFFNARTPSSSFGMLSDDDQISAQLKWFF